MRQMHRRLPSEGTLESGMRRYHFQFRETIATILAEHEGMCEAAKEGMLEARREVERCIALDPFFGSTYSPYRPASGGKTISRMVMAAESANVGPMASVAGAIAWAGMDAMVEAGATQGAIDNGGDIVLLSGKKMLVGIYAGDSPFSCRYAFEIPASSGLFAICTSSATVGHSVSFGSADAVTVFGRDPALADAWATAICNELTPEDQGVLERLEMSACSGEGVTGVFAVFGDRAIEWGDVPVIVRADVEPGLITRGL